MAAGGELRLLPKSTQHPRLQVCILVQGTARSDNDSTRAQTQTTDHLEHKAGATLQQWKTIMYVVHVDMANHYVGIQQSTQHHINQRKVLS